MKPLTPQEIDRYSKLDEGGRNQLRGFAERFSGSTVEWLSPDDAAERERQNQRFGEFADIVASDVRDMATHRQLLHAHRSKETIDKIRAFYSRERRRFFELLFPPRCGYIELRAIRKAKEKEKRRI